ncbi:MAG: STAS domain-containing protein [Chloroflexi bacterium]|nr:STAS domain-containing protein [Chloroflexota bacterium]
MQSWQATEEGEAVNINESHQGEVYVFALDGRIDTEGADALDAKLQTVVKAGHHKIVLDMAEVGYISSNGLRTLADVLTQNKEAHGDLKLVGLNVKVMRVLQIVGFDKFFSIYDTVDAAIADF